MRLDVGESNYTSLTVFMQEYRRKWIHLHIYNQLDACLQLEMLKMYKGRCLVACLDVGESICKSTFVICARTQADVKWQAKTFTYLQL